MVGAFRYFNDSELARSDIKEQISYVIQNDVECEEENSIIVKLSGIDVESIEFDY